MFYLAWAEWSEFTSCSVSCGIGQKTRTRQCSTENTNDCYGTSEESQECLIVPCPDWTPWSGFSPCSVSCGGSGIHERTRQCTSGDQKDCKGESIEIHKCNNGPCPKWGKWSVFSQCSMSCNYGIRTRRRECLTETKCVGKSIENELCNEGPCGKSLRYVHNVQTMYLCSLCTETTIETIWLLMSNYDSAGGYGINVEVCTSDHKCCTVTFGDLYAGSLTRKYAKNKCSHVVLGKYEMPLVRVRSTSGNQFIVRNVKVETKDLQTNNTLVFGAEFDENKWVYLNSTVIKASLLSSKVTLKV